MAEDLANCRPQIAIPRRAQRVPPIDSEFETHIGPTERIGVDNARNEGGLCRNGAEKLEARRYVLEEIAHGDCGPLRAATRPLGDEAATVDLHLEALVAAERARQQGKARDRRDTGERLAAKTKCGDVLQIGERRNFARRMGFDREADILGRHADTVIGDANEVATTLPNLDPHGERTRIQCVLDEFLDDRCRTFNDLARRDLTDEFGREDTDCHLEVPHERNVVEAGGLEPPTSTVRL